MAASAERYRSGPLTNKDPQGINKMKAIVSKITLQDVVIIAFLAVVIFTGVSAMAATANGLEVMNGSF